LALLKKLSVPYWNVTGLEADPSVSVPSRTSSPRGCWPLGFTSVGCGLAVAPLLLELTMRTLAFCRVAAPGVPVSLVLPRTLTRELALPATVSPNRKLSNYPRTAITP
jgi:hypothetical protein